MGGRKGRQGSKSSHTKVAKGKKRAQEGERDGGVLLLVRLPSGEAEEPLESGVSVLGSSSLFPCFQFLLEMEDRDPGAGTGAVPPCLLCAWETPFPPGGAAAPAGTCPPRRPRAQRRLQLLQSGPAADEGLPALQSILSFSHGQPGLTVRKRDRRGRKGRPGRERGAQERVAQGRETGLCAVQSKWKGAVKGAELAFRDTGAAEGSGDERLLEEKEEKSRDLWSVRNRAGREVRRNHPVSLSNDRCAGWGLGVAGAG